MATAKDQTIAAAFDAHVAALLLYSRQWVDGASAEDVVQRVFLKLIASGRIPDDFRTWLFRCVRNEAISALRTSRRRDRREQTSPADAMFSAGPHDSIDVADAQDALLSLPAGYREVVTLRIWSELTFAEISVVTGTPLSTVHDHYRAALAELKQKLEAPCKSQ